MSWKGGGGGQGRITPKSLTGTLETKFEKI